MRAAVTRSGGGLEVVDLPRPVPGPNQLLLEVEASGVCGSDLHLLEVTEAGIVLGHEFTGTVSEVGSGVEQFVAGDRICALPVHSCQRCASCLAGDPVACAQARVTGGHRPGHNAPGSFAELMVVDETAAVRVPAGVEPNEAALVEPLAIGLRLLERAAVRIGDRVLVLGAGTIGLAVTLWARAMGVGQVVVSDPVASRRALAQAAGATAVVDPLGEDVASALDGLVQGPPEVVIECAGRPGIFEEAVRLVARNGRLVVGGMHMTTETFTLREPLMKNLDVRFSVLYGKAHFEHTLAMLAQHRLDVSALVSHRVGLEELPHAVDLMRRGEVPGKVQVVGT